MTEYKTMRVPQEAWEQANDAKQDNETWGEYLQRCAENPPEITEFVEKESTTTVQLEATEYSKIAEEVTHKLEGLQR